MLNIINHQRNVNPNHNKISLTSAKMATVKKSENQVLSRIWENWNPYTLLVSIHQYTQ